MKNVATGLTLLAAIAALGMGTRALANPTINVVASNWKFTPDTIALHVGEETTLRLTSTQGVHGLESADLGIPLTTISPGTFTSVKVVPKKTGKYVLHCAIMCGAGHANMTLTVTVVP